MPRRSQRTCSVPIRGRTNRTGLRKAAAPLRAVPFRAPAIRRDHCCAYESTSLGVGLRWRNAWSRGRPSVTPSFVITNGDFWRLISDIIFNMSRVYIPMALGDDGRCRLYFPRLTVQCVSVIRVPYETLEGTWILFSSGGNSTIAYTAVDMHVNGKWQAARRKSVVRK
jgi:hypothetical protein